jgi:hypothetical protein
MRFGLARFVIFVMRATVRPAISPIGIASAIVAVASFEVFSVRLAAFIAEFFEGVGSGPQSIRCGAERVDEAAIHPTLPASSPAENRLGGNSQLKLDHIFVKSGVQLCQDWGKTRLRQLRKLPTRSKNYPSSSSRCGSSGVSAGGIG